ncbi:MAG: hypothetical protein KFW07_04275, partial [Mycoplasmataceae bacterium]|nr:hypothetical protein [Mycoplasmataceae bacterium]
PIPFEKIAAYKNELINFFRFDPSGNQLKITLKELNEIPKELEESLLKVIKEFGDSFMIDTVPNATISTSDEKVKV